MNDSHDLDDLSVDRFIEDLRGDLPSAEDDARVRRRLQGMGLAIPVVGTSAAATGLAQGGWLSALWNLSAPIKWSMVAVLGVGLPTGVAVGLVRSNEPASHARGSELAGDAAEAAPLVSLSQATVPHAPDRPARNEQTAATPESGASAPTSIAAGRRSSGRTVSPPSPATGDPEAQRRSSTLAAETALIGRALTAIEAGDDASAQRALDEHASQFPHGHLTRERRRAQRRLSRLRKIRAEASAKYTVE